MIEKLIKMLDSKGVREKVTYTTFYVTIGAAMKTIYEVSAPFFEGGWQAVWAITFLTAYVALTAFWFVKFQQRNIRIVPAAVKSWISKMRGPAKGG